MSFALIRLFLGGWLKTGLSALSSFFRSLNSQGWIGLAVCGVLAFLFIRAEGESRHWHKQSVRYEKLYDQEHNGRLADRKSYVDAQAASAAQNKAHVATENKLREQISEASHSDFVSQRDRLRSQSGAAQGAPGAAGVPQVPHAAPGTPPEAVSLPPAELLRAQETELELNALIDWIIAQSKIDPNAEPKP